MIYHLARPEDWENAQEIGAYRVDSLQYEGFIHCSTAPQVLKSAQKHFNDDLHLDLLTLDPNLLDAELIYENTSGGTEDFPHIYGEINLEAVVAVTPLKRAIGQNFEWAP